MLQIIKSISFTLALASIALLATSCASIVTGNHQPISVVTTPVSGATCTLENNKGAWYIAQTPGTVTINRSFEDLHVSCQKKGYKRAFRNVVSSTKPMVFGNVLFGGPIGAGVDIASGAAYGYPNQVVIPL